jgi:hypothetical protein
MKRFKRWCIYRFVFPSNIGKVIDNNGESAHIEYSESQLYSPECWDVKYLWFYDTVEEALKDFNKKSDRNITSSVMYSFPSVFRFKNMESKTLEIYFNTEDLKNLEFYANIYAAVEPTIVSDIAEFVMMGIKG